MHCQFLGCSKKVYPGSHYCSISHRKSVILLATSIADPNHFIQATPMDKMTVKQLADFQDVPSPLTREAHIAPGVTGSTLSEFLI